MTPTPSKQPPDRTSATPPVRYLFRSTRALLLSSTSMVPPVNDEDDRAADRIAVARAYLQRPPFGLRNPFDGSVFWVESEPDNWRELFAEIDAAELAALARKMH